jgi:hypothetical protein
MASSVLIGVGVLAILLLLLVQLKGRGGRTGD